MDDKKFVRSLKDIQKEIDSLDKLKPVRPNPPSQPTPPKKQFKLFRYLEFLGATTVQEMLDNWGMKASDVYIESYSKYDEEYNENTTVCRFYKHEIEDNSRYDEHLKYFEEQSRNYLQNMKIYQEKIEEYELKVSEFFEKKLSLNKELKEAKILELEDKLNDLKNNLY